MVFTKKYSALYELITESDWKSKCKTIQYIDILDVKPSLEYIDIFDDKLVSSWSVGQICH